MVNRKKPWYLVAPVITIVINKLSDYFIEAFIPADLANRILNSSVRVSIKAIVFMAITIVLILYCYLRFNKENKNNKAIVNKATTIALERLEYVESIQVYKVELTNTHECKQIKIDFESGSAKQDIDINSVLQSYYNVPYAIYKKASVFSKYYSSDESVNSIEMAESVGKELCSSIVESLNKIEGVDDIGQYHYEMYRILSSVMPAIDRKSYHSFLENAEIESKLASGKRTGLLGSIILNGLYVFKNQNSNIKNGRLYMSFPLERDKNTIILVTLNNNYFGNLEESNMDSYYNKIMKVCNNLF